MNDAYLPGQLPFYQLDGYTLNLDLGAMVLAHSLRDKGANARIVVLATLDTLSADTITELKVNIIHPPIRGSLLTIPDHLRRSRPNQSNSQPDSCEPLPHGTTRAHIHLYKD
jgi:hypothetical protein